MKGKDVPTMPDGYSTASMIAKKMGFTVCHVTSLMKEAREQGKVKAIKGKNSVGQITWFYKD